MKERPIVMKIYLILFAVFFLALFAPLNLEAQTNPEKPKYAWFEPHLQGETIQLKAVQVDDDKNIYVVGSLLSFDGFRQYDSVQLFDTTFFFSNKEAANFFVKLDSLRHIVWLKLFYGSPDELTLGKDQNLYITGGYFHSVVLSANDSIYTPNESGRFFASYTRNGQYRWSNYYTGPVGTKHSAKIRANSNGELYMTANYHQTCSIPDINVQLPFASSNSDGLSFFGKMDGNGNWVWVDWVPEIHQVYAIGLDEGNGFWIGNTFKDSLVWNDSVYYSSEIDDIFLARINKDGVLQFLKHYQTTGNRRSSIGAIHCGEDGNLYFTGVMGTTLKFGSINPNDSYMDQSHNGYLAALDTNGQEIWFTPIISCCTDFTHLDGDAANNLYVAGIFSEILYLSNDSTYIGNTVRSVVLKFDFTGEHLWNSNLNGNTLNWLRGFDFGAGGAYVVGNSAWGSQTTVELRVESDTFLSIGREIEFIYRIEGDTGQLSSLKTIQFNDFKLYPNPSTNFFKLESILPIQSVILYGIKGEKIQEWQQEESHYQLNDLPSGLYLLRIQSGSQWYSRLIQID